MADRAAPDGGDLGGGPAFAAGLDGARAGALGGGGGALSDHTSMGGGTSGRQVALVPRLLGGDEPTRGVGTVWVAVAVGRAPCTQARL
eukprot:3421714-Prymnesium_polylepis.1